MFAYVFPLLIVLYQEESVIYDKEEWSHPTETESFFIQRTLHFYFHEFRVPFLKVRKHLEKEGWLKETELKDEWHLHKEYSTALEESFYSWLEETYFVRLARKLRFFYKDKLLLILTSISKTSEPVIVWLDRLHKKIKTFLSRR